MSVKVTTGLQAVLAVILVFLLGCSGGQSPVTPGPEVTGQSTGSVSSNTMLWGVWDVTLDPFTGQAEITPVRSAEFTVNVTQFLQPPIAPHNLMSIEIDSATDWMTGYVVVDVIFTHPFPGYELYTGFDVLGVCIGNGTYTAQHDSNVVFAGEEDLRVLNADGLTRWFNPTEFTTYETILGFTTGRMGVPTYDWSATLNGYKYYCDMLESEDDAAEFFANPDCPNPRGYFTAGNTNRRRYELQFPLVNDHPVYTFQYAVIAGWEPTEDHPIEIPDSFNLSANCQEAYVMSTADQSDMYYIDSSAYGGSLNLQLRVFDHQGAAALSTGVADEISAIHLETTNSLIDGDIATFDSTYLAGALVSQDDISATYDLEVVNVTPFDAGVFPVLVVVESAFPDTYESQFPGFDFPDGPLAAYCWAEVTVGAELEPIVISIDPDNGEQDELLTDVEVTGMNFTNGAQVKLVKNDDPLVVVEAGNEATTGSTLITCDLDLDSAIAEIGTYHVVVTNPGDFVGQLDNGFEVTGETWPYWWENNQYMASHGGYNPSATSPDPSDWQEMWGVSAPGTYKNISPIVAGDKVFFLSYTGYYDYSYSARIYAHDLTTGSALWNASVNSSVGSPRINAGFAYYEEGGNEYIVAATDQIYCFDANSSGTNPATLWTYDDTDPNNGYYIGTQMCIYDGKVLAKCQNQASLHILDVVTGAFEYEVPLSGGGECGVGADNGYAYVIAGSHLDCVDIDAGTLEWSASMGHSSVLWNNPLIDENRAYVATSDGYLVCVAVADHDTYTAGDVVWELNYPGTFSAGGCSKLGNDLVVGDVYSSNHVYAITDNGSSASLKWTSSFTGYFDSPANIITTPSYPDGVVVAIDRSTGTIYFIDLTTGSTIHSIATGDSYHRAAPSFVGEYMIVVGGSELQVYHEP